MLLTWIFERPYGQIEDVTDHFSVLRHRIEPTKFNRLNTLNVLQLIHVTLVDGTL